MDHETKQVCYIPRSLVRWLAFHCTSSIVDDVLVPTNLCLWILVLFASCWHVCSFVDCHRYQQNNYSVASFWQFTSPLQQYWNYRVSLSINVFNTVTPSAIKFHCIFSFTSVKTLVSINVFELTCSNAYQRPNVFTWFVFLITCIAHAQMTQQVVPCWMWNWKKN